jgi:MFS family permease
MALLFFTIFNSILGLSMLFPILGPLGRQLSLDETQIASLSAGYSLMQLLLAARWGRASTRYGRKKILLVGVVGFAVGFALFGGVVELGQRRILGGEALFAALLATRLVGASFSSAMLPTAQAFAADLTSRENRTRGMAIIGAAFGLSIIFGPVLGVVVAHFGGLAAPLWFAAGLGLVNAVVAGFKLVEPPRSQEPRALTPSAQLARRALPLLTMATGVTTASVMMEQTISFWVQDRLGLSNDATPRWVGGALLAYGIVAVAAQGGLARRSKLSPTNLIYWGAPVSVVGLAVVGMAPSYGAILLGMALSGLGQGLVLPGVTSALSLSASEAEQGDIAGLGSTAQALGRLVGPPLGAMAYQFDPRLPFLGASALSLVLLALAASRRTPTATQPG